MQNLPVSPSIDSHTMNQWRIKTAFTLFLLIAIADTINGEDPYRFFNWNVTYGDIYPLGVKQQVLYMIFTCNFFQISSICSSISFLNPVTLLDLYWIRTFVFQGILINGQFPGPQIDCVTNDNVIVSVFNSLDEPFLITWSVDDNMFLNSCL